MSNDDKHSLDDLFDGKGTKGDDGSIDGTDTSGSAVKRDDDSGDLLDTLPNEDAKEQFVKAWTKKIEAGEATIDQLKGKQAWLVPLVESRLNAVKAPKVDRTEMAKLAREEVQKMLEEERSHNQAEQSFSQFSQLKEKVKSLGLTSAQKVTIQETFKKYSDKLSPLEALNIACEVAHVDFNDSIDTKRGFSPKTGGTAPRQQKVDLLSTDPNSFSKEDRYKWVAEQRAGR